MLNSTLISYGMIFLAIRGMRMKREAYYGNGSSHRGTCIFGESTSMFERTNCDSQSTMESYVM